MNTPNQNQHTPAINRRAFVKTAALAGAGLAAGPAIIRDRGQNKTAGAATPSVIPHSALRIPPTS